MSLREVIERFDGHLTESDRRLVGELLEHPRESAFLSVSHLADRVQVHPATVVRLARKLGFDGYPDLRSRLQADVIEKPDAAERIRRALARMDDDSILAALVHSEIETLELLLEHVTMDQIREAAEVLIGARQIFLFGQGQAYSLAYLVDRRLRRAGYATNVLPNRRREIAEKALVIGAEDAVLAFSMRNVPSGLVPLLDHANQVGAKTILVADMIGPVVRPAPDILLAAPRGAEDEFHTLTVPMAICNALVLGVSRLDGGKSIEKLRKLSSIIKEFEK